MQPPNTFLRVASYVIEWSWSAEEPGKFDTTWGLCLGMVELWGRVVTAGAMGDSVDRACAGEDGREVGSDRGDWSDVRVEIVILLFFRLG